MTKTDQDSLTVIYNDTCPVCAREIAAHKRFTQKHKMKTNYVGLQSSELPQFGLSKADAARRFHVLKDGQLYDGIPAFAILWERLPHLRWLAYLVRVPVISVLAAGVYDHIAAPVLFALHRRRERLGKAVRRG